jgi:hypothetical protein
MEVASRTQIDPDRLRAMVSRGVGRGDGPSAGGGTAGAAGGASGVGALRISRPAGRAAPAASGPEREALRLLMEQPDDIIDWLDDELFADETALDAYRLLLAHDDPRAAIAAADDNVRDLLQWAALADSDAEPMDVAVRLLQEAARRALVRVDAEARQSDDPLAFAADAAFLKLRMEELADPHRSVEAADQLLAWLTQQSGDDPETSEGT